MKTKTYLHIISFQPPHGDEKSLNCFEQQICNLPSKYPTRNPFSFNLRRSNTKEESELALISQFLDFASYKIIEAVLECLKNISFPSSPLMRLLNDEDLREPFSRRFSNILGMVTFKACLTCPLLNAVCGRKSSSRTPGSFPPDPRSSATMSGLLLIAILSISLQLLLTVVWAGIFTVAPRPM